MPGKDRLRQVVISSRRYLLVHPHPLQCAPSRHRNRAMSHRKTGYHKPTFWEGLVNLHTWGVKVEMAAESQLRFARQTESE